MPLDAVPDPLAAALQRHSYLLIAVSGGVDSMTLAHAAQRVLGRTRVVICHAVSPAVPSSATARVRKHAAEQGWDLRVLEAGEFADPDYLRNPVNRCYFCKSNLYDRIRAVSNGGAIASGANLSDLGDYRPGLTAAAERDICHPFVEAKFSKADVRGLARGFGLSDLSELPAQPCLASRIETGITVRAEDLLFVELVEAALSQHLSAATLRCRIVGEGVRLELGDDLLADPAQCERLIAEARALCKKAGRTLVDVTGYRKGSAFLHEF